MSTSHPAPCTGRLRPAYSIIVSLTLLGLLPGQVLAQTPPAGRVDVSIGVRWTGELPVGAADATETAPGGSRYRLFATESALSSAAGVEAGVGVRLTRVIEAGFLASFATPELRSHIRSDAEGAADAEAVEGVSQLSLEASLVVHLSRWALGGRATPFLSAGGGYLRQLHEGRTLVETGTIAHAGGGLTVMLTTGGRGLLKATGLRADARAVVRTGGIAFEEETRVAPALGLSLFARF